MASKKEMTAQLTEIFKAHDMLDTDVANEVLAVVAPKKKVSNLEDVVCRDADGNVTHIKCSKLGVWFEANAENFYEKDDELGFSRFTRLGEKLRKAADKQFKATKDAVLNDVLEGNITSEEGKVLLAEAEEARNNIEIPEDVVYFEEKPC